LSFIFFILKRAEQRGVIIAKAHAIKSARYPALYEMLKTPPAARKALKNWKNEGKQAALEEASTSTPALEGVSDRPLIQDGQVAADENSGSQNTEAQNTAAGSRPRESAPVRNSSEPRTDSGDQMEAAPPFAALSTSMVVRGDTLASSLPPQYMTFSESLLQKTRRGKRLVVTCNLAKSYPNFHIECNYVYIDQHERVNLSQTDTRTSFAIISTKENIWAVATEKKGYNEDFIKGLVGDAEYARLEGDASGPVKGHSKSYGSSVVAKVAKKVTIPDGFDLGGIWCKAGGVL
jgi:hypothetical protein